MIFHDAHTLKVSCVAGLRRRAMQGTYSGFLEDIRQRLYLDRCRAFHRASGTMLMFTRDDGMHSSGWWKDPDYERCEHLSLSFRAPLTGEPIGWQPELAEEWVVMFFGDRRRFLWEESAKYPEGREVEVRHFRLFLEPDWWTPILPRSEVYTRAFTERGWKSWSDARAARGADAALTAARLAESGARHAAGD